MQINFCNTTKFSFLGSVGDVVISMSKILNYYYTINQFVRKYLFFTAAPMLSKYS